LAALAVLLMFAAWPRVAAAQAPIRLLVIANTAQLLPEAFDNFEQTYGAGLIDLDIASTEVEPERLRNADVILAYFLSAVAEQRLTDEVRAARDRGVTILVAPGGAGQRNWNLDVDEAINRPVVEYWDHGGVDNMTAFLAYVYTIAGGTRGLRVPSPVPQVDRGIYHPRASEPFESLDAYLAWYHREGIVRPEAPLVGLAFFSTNWKYHDLEHIDALIDAFEQRGIGVVAAFDWPLGAMEDLLAVDGRSPLRTLFVLNQSMAARPEDPVLLEKLGVHTINLMATRQSRQEWEDDVRGLPLDRVRNTLDLPESAGASEPMLFATFEPVPGLESRVNRAVPERLDAIVRRTERWIALQDKPNGEKRLAFIYYNNPPGRGNVGASYLDVYPTLRNVLARLRQEGYDTGVELPDADRLKALLETSGRNIELWAPGDLAEMVADGSVTLVPMAQYREWFAELPERYRVATIERWGPPDSSALMTVTKDGERYLVVPGVRIGNIFIGPQPLRQTFEEAGDTAHDTVTPVPHQYVAAYLWYRHTFAADAVVHVGRHGTLEWLPGKQTAQAGWDTSEVLLGDLPNAYFYIMDGGAEAIQAKRRSAAVIVSHLTPMIVNAGELSDFAALHDALENLERTEGSSAELAETYRTEAFNEIRRLKLDGQLGFDLVAEDWPAIEERVHTFLHDTENDTVPLGVHVLGQAPPEQNQREGLAAFFRSAFDEREAEAVEADLQPWADAVFDGRIPEVAPSYAPDLREKIAGLLAEGETWVEHVRESPARELESIVTVLAGRYLPTAPIGDPLHVPDSLPTGRNEHASDSALIPTRAAWAVGRRMADEFVARYLEEHGEYPGKVSQVLWSGETLRHQGAFESMALALMGVEPIWNARNVVDNLRLMPPEELGRPRVDVIFTISGIYRDGLPEKVLLLDRAARLAASAGDNAISRNDRRIAQLLEQNGVDADVAAKIARARVFGNKPSAYGVGVSSLVERSRDADGRTDDVGNVYLHYMNYAFSAEVWGGTAEGALANHLQGNQAVVFSRATSLYGALDNDDVYQYFGGLSVASKTVNKVAPEMYINNLRKAGSESMTDLRSWLASELNTRNWNPKWLTEMQRSGYAGAREMAKSMEYLYGFQATSAEQVDGTFWQNSYDVLVADKHGLGLDEFFKRENPYAQQSIVARMLEVDRQGSYQFSDADRENLVRIYVESVARDGVSCSANTCGNEALQGYVSQQVALIEGLGQEAAQRFGQEMARATGENSSALAPPPAAVLPDARSVQPPSPEPVETPSSQRPPTEVTGYRLEDVAAPTASTSLPFTPWPYVAMAILVLYGMIHEARPRRRSP
jgi:cobaltochelatase CobN